MLDRLVGYEVSNVAFRRIGPGTSAGRVQSVATRLVVDRERARMAFRAASYWDLEGLRSTPASAVAPAPEAETTPLVRSLAASAALPLLAQLDGKRPASGRDFDPNTGRLVGARRRTRSSCSTRPRRRRSRRDSSTSRSPSRRWSRGSPPSGRRRRSPRRRCSRRRRASSGTARHARCTSRRGSTSAASSPTCAPTPRTCRTGDQRGARGRSPRMYGDEYLPAEPASVPLEGEERAGGARGDPPRRRSDADRGRPRPRAPRDRRAAALRPDLEAHHRLPDGRRPHPAGHAPPRRHLDRGRGRVFQATGRTIEFLGYLRAYVEGADDPDAELEDREALLPPLDEGDAVACAELHAVGAHHAAARSLHRGEPREGARGARHRPTVDLRERDRHDLQARLRVEEGQRAGAVVDGVREGAAARALLRPPHRLRVHRHDGRGARRDRARRGRSREVAALLLLRERHGRARASSSPRSTSRRSTRPRSTPCTSGSTTRVASWSCACGRTAPTSSAATNARRSRSTSRPTSSRPSVADDLLARGSGGPRELGSDPETRASQVLVLTGRFGPFVQLGEQQEDGASGKKGGEAEARVAVRVDGAEHRHARRGARAAVAAARRRRRRRGRRDHRAERALRAVPEEGHRQPQPRDRGADVHGHAGGGRGDLRAAEAAGPRRGEAAARRARRAPRVGRAGADARRPLRSVRHRRHRRTRPCPGASTSRRSPSSRPSSCCASARPAARPRRRRSGTTAKKSPAKKRRPRSRRRRRPKRSGPRRRSRPRRSHGEEVDAAKKTTKKAT